MTTIRTRDGRTIIAERTYEPRPAPSWLAIEDDTYDGPGSPIGEGASEGDAVLDLLTQLEERDG